MKVEDYALVVERALREDLGDRGDITSEAVVPAETYAVANLVARAGGVVAGMVVAQAVFATVDPNVDFEPAVADGMQVTRGTVLARVSGRARAILTAERTALNLLGRMSGVATATAELVNAVAGTGARITDTRKTMPGLRFLDKYAVTVGGGVNHRMGLYDQVMIKDNHIVAAGGIGEAVAAVRELHGHTVKVTVEVEDLNQLAVLLESGADRVLLDNMDVDTLREAVGFVGGEMETEASGGVTTETVRVIAETGVDFISVGWITHSAPQMDIALDFL
jgi:nicotinate-nucleotide pyrophosphorylase (carboxylating)